jgi:hypothetical protein
MKSLLTIGLVLVAWFLLVRYVLPKLGIKG